jgi:tetratricopeptide (TPR) repeat protein
MQKQENRMDQENITKTPEEISAEGFQLVKSGDHEKALELFTTASDLFLKDEDLKNQAVQLQAISEIYRLTKQVEKAVKTCEELIEIYDRIEEYEQMYRVLNNMGLLEVGRKKYDSALNRFKSALETAEKIGNKKYAALQTGNIGSIYRDTKQSDQAIEYYEKALSLHEESGVKEGVGDQYSNIAYIHVVEGRLADAVENYKKAISIYIEIENMEKAHFTEQNIDRLEAVIRENQ